MQRAKVAVRKNSLEIPRGRSTLVRNVNRPLGLLSPRAALQTAATRRKTRFHFLLSYYQSVRHLGYTLMALGTRWYAG